ncbi:hypothetical protein K435DRAFT_800509 [Dendrothele bispora CBS 962.96]|uniref:Uncharacterized protein n=1 Tax=Dendrothele bispora (strain CBS 962.96) TaxID=1314807 RepID=A0A4S8LSV3_DENBC|nr:hypothetical protein K435DRAFT_800509 [Dendrothele bispora CBS 962.96]
MRQNVLSTSAVFDKPPSYSADKPHGYSARYFSQNFLKLPLEDAEKKQLETIDEENKSSGDVYSSPFVPVYRRAPPLAVEERYGEREIWRESWRVFVSPHSLQEGTAQIVRKLPPAGGKNVEASGQLHDAEASSNIYLPLLFCFYQLNLTDILQWSLQSELSKAFLPFYSIDADDEDLIISARYVCNIG